MTAKGVYKYFQIEGGLHLKIIFINFSNYFHITILKEYYWYQLLKEFKKGGFEHPPLREYATDDMAAQFSNNARLEEEQINKCVLCVFVRIRILYEVADNASLSIHIADAADQISCTKYICR